MTISARVIADSMSPAGKRITTFVCEYPRFIHSEVMTHRMLCLAGDSMLEFDLPAGSRGSERRVHRMRLDEFVDKWQNGARRIGAKPKRAADLAWSRDDGFYTTVEIAARLGMAAPANLNRLCREEQVEAHRAEIGKAWLMTGAAVRRWRRSKPDATRYDMRERLAGMRIRQLNEKTGDIQWSHVTDAVVSGTKAVYDVVAGDYRVAGSADHRVLTVAGWKRIGDLMPGTDQILVRRFGKQADDKLDPTRLKKIDGVWRSTWQREKRQELIDADSRCRRCREDPGEEVHHIVPVCVDPSRAFDPSNITLLCMDCHEVMHRRQDWQGGTYLYGAAVTVQDVLFRGEEPTYDLSIAGEFHNFLANGVVVHNSRNAASSRAIPVSKMLSRVFENPATPEWWGKNQKGMQAAEELDLDARAKAEKLWWGLRRIAHDHSSMLSDIGLHKQITNRILEPWLTIVVVITATEWDNFYHLRLDALAQPEFRILAERMLTAHNASEPRALRYGEWHLPFISEDEKLDLDGRSDFELWLPAIKASVARCARVSTLNHDGSAPDQAADLALHDRLLAAHHVSPFEHQARPADPFDVDMTLTPQEDLRRLARYRSGNFVGWHQYRKDLTGENVERYPGLLDKSHLAKRDER